MDLMHGNPKLRELGFKEEALGHNAIAGGFQGQRQWTDWMPNALSGSVRSYNGNVFSCQEIKGDRLRQTNKRVAYYARCV